MEKSAIFDIKTDEGEILSADLTKLFYEYDVEYESMTVIQMELKAYQDMIDCSPKSIGTRVTIYRDSEKILSVYPAPDSYLDLKREIKNQKK